MRNALILHYVAGLALTLLLSACGSQPTPDSPTGQAAPVVEEFEPPSIELEVGQYAELLTNAQSYLQRRELIPAASALAEVDASVLEAGELALYRELQIQLFYTQGKLELARQLTHQALADQRPLSAESLWNLQQWQLRLLRDAGLTLQRARFAADILGMHDDAAYQSTLNQGIWQDLQSTSIASLRKELERSRSSEWRGWLELALLDNGLPQEPKSQRENWLSWLRQYPQHPAALSPPGGQNDIPQKAPQRIALLLPMSGPLASAAESIVDGFLAAMMQARAQGWPEQDLLLIDIANHADINSAYQAAATAGAEMIVGPLTRKNLAKFDVQLAPKTPILTLNWHDNLARDNIFQMALAPEDEARQLAQMAHGDGARRALVIQPAGDFGEDMYRNFEQAWREQGGEIGATAVYTQASDYSTSIQAALQLADSEQRAKQVRRLMDSSVEFSPRRRQDVDSVFLFAGSPQEARSLKPLLAFHYAGNLPVYSTSHIYSGKPDPTRDRDLNGIQLLELPWSLEQSDPLKREIVYSDYQENLAAMYALGADAFLLHWRLNQLATVSGTSVRGHTGLLSMDASGRVHRQLSAAKISAGVPVARK